MVFSTIRKGAAGKPLAAHDARRPAPVDMTIVRRSVKPVSKMIYCGDIGRKLYAPEFLWQHEKPVERVWWYPNLELLNGFQKIETKMRVCVVLGLTEEMEECAASYIWG